MNVIAVCHNIQQRLNSNSLVFQVAQICLAGEERMHHISSQIVGDNPKGEIAPFSGGQVNSCQILGLTFAPIHNHMQNLMRIVQEHVLSIEPQIGSCHPPSSQESKE